MRLHSSLSVRGGGLVPRRCAWRRGTAMTALREPVRAIPLLTCRCLRTSPWSTGRRSRRDEPECSAGGGACPLRLGRGLRLLLLRSGRECPRSRGHRRPPVERRVLADARWTQGHRSGSDRALVPKQLHPRPRARPPAGRGHPATGRQDGRKRGQRLRHQDDRWKSVV